ncbi:hypothetical protein C5S53_15835 [Methanophagales archaeon]|nr:hypothetical protein C5S53_15835 [Methanophagales archaeon]
MKKISTVGIVSMSVIAILSISATGNVAAALPPPSADFEIDFSGLNLPEGDWQLSLVSIPAYGKGNMAEAEEIFNTIKSSYLDIKNLCGVPDYIELKLNPTQEELESYSDEEILARYNLEGDLYYEILTEKNCSVCCIPLGYGLYNPNFSSILEHKYKATKNFWIHHYDKGVELHKGGEDIKSFYPLFCEIENNSCRVHVWEDTQGPYFVALEKMNSKDEIYFSEPVNIDWEASGEVEWKIFPEQNTYPLNINKLELSEPNLLLIEFGNSEPCYFQIFGEVQHPAIDSVEEICVIDAIQGTRFELVGLNDDLNQILIDYAQNNYSILVYGNRCSGDQIEVSALVDTRDKWPCVYIKDYTNHSYDFHINPSREYRTIIWLNDAVTYMDGETVHQVNYDCDNSSGGYRDLKETFIVEKMKGYNADINDEGNYIKIAKITLQLNYSTYECFTPGRDYRLKRFVPGADRDQLSDTNDIARQSKPFHIYIGNSTSPYRTISVTQDSSTWDTDGGWIHCLTLCQGIIRQEEQSIIPANMTYQGTKYVNCHVNPSYPFQTDKELITISGTVEEETGTRRFPWIAAVVDDNYLFNPETSNLICNFDALKGKSVTIKGYSGTGQISMNVPFSMDVPFNLGETTTITFDNAFYVSEIVGWRNLCCDVTLEDTGVISTPNVCFWC